MTTFFAVIGGIFVFCLICGAIVPGLNCHIVFADDKSALEWHQSQAEKIAKRLAAKEPS